MSAQRYDHAAEADALFDQLTQEDDPGQREVLLKGALRAVEMLMRETADRIHRARSEVR